MDVLGIFIIIAFTGIVLLYLYDIRQVLFSAKKSRLEYSTVIVSIIVVFSFYLFLDKLFPTTF